METKKTLRNVLTIILSTMLMLSTGTVAFAEWWGEGETIEVYSENELLELFSYGGRGVLMEDIDDDYGLQMDLLSDVVLDMNGHSISLWVSDCTFYGKLVMINNTDYYSNLRIVVDRGDYGVYWENMGTIVAKNVDIYSSDVDQFGTICMIGGEYLIGYRNNNYGLVAYLDNTFDGITEDKALEIANTLKLPDIERNDFFFSKWTSKEKEVVSLNGLKGTMNIKANWSSAVEVSFDHNNGTGKTDVYYPDNDTRFFEFPFAENPGYCLDGWAFPNGEKATTETEFLQPVTLKAVWVLESDRADELAKSMKDMGFNHTKIEQVVAGLNQGDGTALTGSAFSDTRNSNLPLIALVAVAGIIVVAVLFRKKNSKNE